MIETKLAELQLPRFEKDASNPHFKNRYITLDQIMAKIRPVLKAKSLIITHAQCAEGLTTKIVDIENEDKITTFYPIPSTLSGQKLGSELTYARRYSICLLLAIVADEDDDGNQAATTPEPEKPKKPDISKFLNSSKIEYQNNPAGFSDWTKDKCQKIEDAFGTKWAEFARFEIDTLCSQVLKIDKIFNVSSVTLDANGDPA